MGNPSDPVVPSIFIYGHPSSGKTSVVRSLFERALPREHWAFLNCVECYTPRILFEHTLDQWCNWTPSHENQYTSVCKVDNIHHFVKVLQDGVVINNKSCLAGNETRYMVRPVPEQFPELIKKLAIQILDRAERLRDMPSTMLPVLLRLSEISQRNICVILLSNIVFEKFRMKGGSYEPLFIRFSDYSKADILRILQNDFKAAGQRIRIRPEEDDEEEECFELDDAFYAGFTEIIYSIFNHNCKDLNELRYFAALLFPLYMKPVKDGLVEKHETHKLVKLAQPYFAEATDKLYLREISSAEWTKQTQILEEMEDIEKKPGPFLKHTRESSRVDFDLPYFTKFLLIASYLASYNPPRFDVRYFSKTAEQRKKKKGGGTRNSRVDAQGGGKMRQQLLGPKAFPVERMLAIFYSIVDDSLEDTIDIQQQITSLTTLRLLVRATSLDRLDAAKYKCNVSFDFIRGVARTVRFEIENYLYDFC
ncbi:Origin recognition complex subunit 5 [Apophysomyces ossiformis]|uniref:Origin recognition complex subunit 5 n=1 Tax=Apophysomyces ossiformis TaxID=679940 RepID=A0A8H7BLC0_9FUNG|nr:Origin recognition complex subunit 5 [Apophysomyces ossiformis]